MANSVMKLFLLPGIVAVILAESLSQDGDRQLDQGTKDPLPEVFKSLSKEEKDDFLVYFLAHGFKEWVESQGRLPKFFPPGSTEAFINALDIPEENKQKFQEMNIPKESTVKLLEWTKSRFSLSTREVLDLLRTRKCKNGKGCNLPDIGEICCPW